MRTGVPLPSDPGERIKLLRPSERDTLNYLPLSVNTARLQRLARLDL